MDDDVTAVGDAQRLREVLLRHQHGELVLVLELLDLVDGTAHQHGRETDRRLVDQQDARVEHQRARQRQHLLLAAAHRAGELVAPFFQAIEHAVTEVEIACHFGARGRAERAEQEILLDGELGKQPPPLRHQRNAEIDDFFRRAADQIVLLAVDLGDDRSGARPHHAHDTFHQRRLAVAVGAEQHDGLAVVHLDRHVLDDADRAVAGMNAAYGDAVSQGRPSPPRGCARPRPAFRPRSFCPKPARRAAARNSSPRS